MADLQFRTPENVPGAYYVDETCIDCDMCRSTAPEFFRRQEDRGYTCVHRQPQTAEDLALAEEAMRQCPTESIGNDGVTAAASAPIADAEAS